MLACAPFVADFQILFDMTNTGRTKLNQAQ
jgi:hypothetical protein